MLLSRVVVLAGVAALSSSSNVDLGTTLSTKYIEQLPSSQTTYSTSWRIKNAPSTTSIDENDDGWTVVSETESPATDIRETSTDDGAGPQPTSSRPNNAMIAHRMAMVAGATWGRFPTKPDNETEVRYSYISCCVILSEFMLTISSGFRPVPTTLQSTMVHKVSDTTIRQLTALP